MALEHSRGRVVAWTKWLKCLTVSPFSSSEWEHVLGENGFAFHLMTVLYRTDYTAKWHLSEPFCDAGYATSRAGVADHGSFLNDESLRLNSCEAALSRHLHGLPPIGRCAELISPGRFGANVFVGGGLATLNQFWMYP